MLAITGWINTDAKNQVDCPKCKSVAGVHCKFPSGGKCKTPHTERTKKYRESISRKEFDIRHCVKSSLTFHDLISKSI